MEMDKAFRPKKGIAYRKIQDEMVLVDPAENTLLRLNETASLIWDGLEKKNLSAIVEDVVHTFDVSREVAAQDVAKFMDVLLDKSLVVEAE